MKSTFGIHLTRREREVLSLCAQGHTAVSVARNLRCAKRTVEFHKDNAYKKLGARNMIEAARALGWLVVPE